MATLTPLSKGLIGLAVIGAVTSAVWHLGLKDWMAGADFRASSPGTTATAPTGASTTAITTPPPSPTTATPIAAPAATAASKPAPVANAPAQEAVAPSPAVAPAPPSAPAAHLSPAESSEMGRKLMDSGDFVQARIYLEQAVRDGDGVAACLLGEMTLKGQGGITADQNAAASLFQVAQSKNIICFASGK